MPPFLMLIFAAFVVLMVMFGNNPLDQWRIEKEKYGKDPLAREINKFNEKRSKEIGSGGVMPKYKPPPGSTVYYLPPDQAPIPPKNPFDMPSPGGEEMVRPAPDVPMDQWNNPYPYYMYAPQGAQMPGSNMGYIPEGTGTAVGRPGGTSIVPGGR